MKDPGFPSGNPSPPFSEPHCRALVLDAGMLLGLLFGFRAFPVLLWPLGKVEVADGAPEGSDSAFRCMP